MESAYRSTLTEDTLAPSPPNPTLTRACKACIQAKRKCSFQLPKCARCQKRQTICEYQNQPLQKQKAHAVQDRNLGDTWHTLESTFSTSSELPNPNLSPLPIRLDEPISANTIEERTLHYLEDEFKMHILSFGRTGMTP